MWNLSREIVLSRHNMVVLLTVELSQLEGVWTAESSGIPPVSQNHSGTVESPKINSSPEHGSSMEEAFAKFIDNVRRSNSEFSVTAKE